MMSKDTKAIKDHGRLLLYRKEEKIASQPISRISSVVVTKQAHMTMPLVYALLEEGVPISYMRHTRRGVHKNADKIKG